MIEALFQKAIEGAGRSYSPQQVAEMLDVNSRNIDLLDEKIKSLFWGLMGIIIIFQAFSVWRFLCIEKRMKKLEVKKEVLP